MANNEKLISYDEIYSLHKQIQEISREKKISYDRVLKIVTIIQLSKISKFELDQPLGFEG